MWVKRRTNPIDFFALFTDDGYDPEFMHLNLTAPGPVLELAVSGGGDPRFAPSWAPGEWHHVVVTYDAQEASTRVKFYLDGQLFDILNSWHLRLQWPCL
ncbi:MAG: LamG domain-containing protein [Candidatus Omnitrophica bacterium]|nr:LamG domain-containing protein [Candidatus Omnitrophota bacterium]